MRLIVACALFLLSVGAYAQGYPNRPVKLVVADAALGERGGGGPRARRVIRPGALAVVLSAA